MKILPKNYDYPRLALSISFGPLFGLCLGIIIGRFLDEARLGISIGPLVGICVGGIVGTILEREHVSKNILFMALGIYAGSLLISGFIFWCGSGPVRGMMRSSKIGTRIHVERAVSHWVGPNTWETFNQFPNSRLENHPALEIEH